MSKPTVYKGSYVRAKCPACERPVVEPLLHCPPVISCKHCGQNVDMTVPPKEGKDDPVTTRPIKCRVCSTVHEVPVGTGYSCCGVSVYALPDGPDQVNHPSHYTAGKIEPIDVIEDWDLGFCLGNAVKYIARAGKKGDRLEDLRKARWYLDRQITRETTAQ